MKNSRFSEQQIIKILKSADAGMKGQDLCHSFSSRRRSEPQLALGFYAGCAQFGEAVSHLEWD
jgi:hypothetical protein